MGAGSARPVVALAQQILEGRDQVAPHRAAQAAGAEQDHVLIDGLDEQVIEADLPEFVDDHHRVGERRIAQQPIQKGSLPGPQEAGEHGQRDRLRAS